MFRQKSVLSLHPGLLSVSALHRYVCSSTIQNAYMQTLLAIDCTRLGLSLDPSGLSTLTVTRTLLKSRVGLRSSKSYIFRSSTFLSGEPPSGSFFLFRLYALLQTSPFCLVCFHTVYPHRREERRFFG